MHFQALRYMPTPFFHVLTIRIDQQRLRDFGTTSCFVLVFFFNIGDKFILMSLAASFKNPSISAVDFSVSCSRCIGVITTLLFPPQPDSPPFSCFNSMSDMSAAQRELLFYDMLQVELFRLIDLVLACVYVIVQNMSSLSMS